MTILQQYSSRVIGMVAALLLSLPATGMAQAFFTDFEFTDTSGEFTITDGDPAVTATFTGGEAKSVGNTELYLSGMNAWMIDSGNTGTISLDEPANEIALSIRSEPGTSAQSTLQAFDINGDPLTSVNGSQDQWTDVSVVADDPATGISTIVYENTGADGYVVMEDVTINAEATMGGLDDPIPDPIEPGRLRVALQTIATGLTAPNWGTYAPGSSSDMLFVTDQIGVLWKISLSSGEKSVFLDVRDRLVELGIDGPGTFDERGLLGVAFHPDYMSNGLLYTYTSEPAVRRPDFRVPLRAAADHHSVITEWYVADPADPSAVVDPSSARVLMRIGQPQFNHDGGTVTFGPDRMLHISLGDGGSADDQGDGHVEQGNGQTPRNILGNILRIDPTGSNSRNGNYGIPDDNPFVDRRGFRDEIFAYGFRNPFRMSFDMATGELYVADVGQNDIEEVDMVTAGGNYGWNFKEGSFFFDPNGDDAGFVTDVDPGVPDDLIDPILEYDHDEGIAIIGGFVYRGSDIRRLVGRYIFGDFAQTFSNDGRLFYRVGSGIREFRLSGQSALGLSLLGFGQDANGEVYVLANGTGTPFEETGVVLKITPAR